MMKQIKVTNNTEDTIEVAINHWGKDGNTSFFKIPKSKTEKWERSSDLGFVMIVQHEVARRPYYVHVGYDIKVEADNVMNNGNILKPIA